MKKSNKLVIWLLKQKSIHKWDFSNLCGVIDSFACEITLDMGCAS